ncbi:MAG: (Fe-S)-binding protein [Candidatus Obscuribacterales bacterium]|nr:(Fe-S)-binding protein [Candidatus Obscuribacterales bacterium]
MSQDKSDVKTDLISADLLAACIHCGLCLPACPTYLVTGRETESPRGRIYLLSEYSQGRLDLTPRLSEHIDSCLGCLGCQTACPSGVQYEKILSQARPILAQQRAGWYRFVLRSAFSRILPEYRFLQQLGRLLRFYQKSRLQGFVTEILDKLSGSTVQVSMADSPSYLVPPSRNLFAKFSIWQKFLPIVPQFKPLPQKSWRTGSKVATVQFFSGCVMDVFYNHVNHACMRLLAAQSNVVERPAQTCCGALAFHAGEVDITVALAKKNIEYFESTQGEIVVSAAGCGAILKEYAHLFVDQLEWAERAQRFSDRVKDITESLNAGQFSTQPKEFPIVVPKKIAYHAACHLAHAQNVHTQPTTLLRQLVEDCKTLACQGDIDGRIPVVPELVPLKDNEQCCGSAGIYNVLHPDMALAVLANKMEAVEKSGADLLVTTNPGCMLQLEAGIKQNGLNVEVKHLAELLDDFYCGQT